MFAKKNGSTGIRKKQLENPEPKLRFKTSGMKGNRDFYDAQKDWDSLSVSGKRGVLESIDQLSVNHYEQAVNHSWNELHPDLRNIILNQWKRHGDTSIMKGKRELGRGAEVEITELFGLKDIPVGTKGIVTDHTFGRDRPTVQINGHRYVLDADKLKIVKGSKDYLPIQYDRIEAGHRTKHELENRLKENTHLTDNKDGWFSGYEYLDNGEGDSFDLPFSVHVQEGKVDVHVQKQNLPKRWQWDFDSIRENIVDKITAALGITN